MHCLLLNLTLRLSVTRHQGGPARVLRRNDPVFNRLYGVQKHEGFVLRQNEKINLGCVLYHGEHAHAGLIPASAMFLMGVAKAPMLAQRKGYRLGRSDNSGRSGVGSVKRSSNHRSTKQ